MLSPDRKLGEEMGEIKGQEIEERDGWSHGIFILPVSRTGFQLGIYDIS